MTGSKLFHDISIILKLNPTGITTAGSYTDMTPKAQAKKR